MVILNRNVIKASLFPWNARGSIVLNLIIILVITGIIGVTMMSLTSTTLVQQVYSDSSHRADLLAESGFRYLASRYKHAVDSVARNLVLKELHGRTFVLGGDDGRFSFSVYPYVYMARSAVSAGASQVPAEFFGAKPDSLTLPASGIIGILSGTRYTLYNYSSITGDTLQFNFMNIIDASDLTTGLNSGLAIGSTIYPVFVSEVKVLSSGSGNSLVVPGSGTFMPLSDGVFEIIDSAGEMKDGSGVKTKIYTYKKRTGNTLYDISVYREPSAAFSLSLTADTRIVVHRSAEIVSTGTVYPGSENQTNRSLKRMSALGYTLAQVSAADLIYDNPDNVLQSLISGAEITGDSDTVSEGKIGPAMTFDGDLDYVRLGDDVALDLGAAGSIGAWVKVTAFDNNFAGIIRKGGLAGDSDLSYSLEFRAGQRIRLRIVGVSTSLYLDSGTVLSEGIWYHVAGTWGPGGMALYIDGHLDSSRAETLIARNTAGTVQIGAQLDELFNPAQKNFGFHGLLDEVFIYNTQESLCEIRDIFSNPCNTGCDAYAYYPFNGNYEDGSGETKAGIDMHNGSPTGTAIAMDRFGCSERACEYQWFDYVEIPSESDFDLTGPFTLSLWVRVSNWSLILGNDILLNKGNNSYRITRYGYTDIAAFRTNGLSRVDTYGNDDVGDGIWHHIAAVYNGTRKDIYVDGERDDSDTVSGTLTQNNTRLRIGSTGLFTGWIDDVAIWKRALSQDEIENIYKGIRTDPTLP